MANLCRSKPGRSVLVLISVALLLACIVPGAARGQVLYGTIVGYVKDTSQAAVPGATVTIINPKTNVTREAITNESGTYTVSNVLPGT